MFLYALHSWLDNDFTPFLRSNIISFELFLQIDSTNGSGVSVRVVVGIVAVGAFVLFLVLGILWWKGCLGQKSRMGQGI
mgnify:CR=1 FL=1